MTEGEDRQRSIRLLFLRNIMSVQAQHDSYAQFADRHIGPNNSDLSKILSFIGYSSLDELSNAAVPTNIQNQAPLALAPGASEAEVLAEVRTFA
ncbi:MAG: hypothetical protein F2774_08060, partial [Actinobacteria bacterium]|nr:hypothetical protein [Actinomycetota bacterium]